MSRPRRMPPKGSYRNVPAGVPPVAPRRGRNSLKQDEARSERKRTKRAGLLRRALSLFRNLLVAALAAAAVGGGGVAAWRAFDTTGFLVLRDVEVPGNRLWDRKAILEKAGVELGVRLFAVPVRKVEAAVASLPGIAGAEVERAWPSRLVIKVVERQPVACGYSKGWRGLASDGALLPGLDMALSDLPVVDGFAALGAERRAELGAFLESVRTAYPALYGSFSQLSVADGKSPSLKGRQGVPADLEIVLRDGRLRVMVEMGNKSLNSLEFLQTLLRRQKAALPPGGTVDLRVEGYAYVR
jgi:cell division septal protein FtsQ